MIQLFIKKTKPLRPYLAPWWVVCGNHNNQISIVDVFLTYKLAREYIKGTGFVMPVHSFEQIIKYREIMGLQTKYVPLAYW